MVERRYPEYIRQISLVMVRIDEVRKMRLAMAKIPTQELATTPSMFGEIRQPNTNYLAVPETSSQNRNYMPADFLSANIVASNSMYAISDADV
jgi:hypothetical protein